MGLFLNSFYNIELLNVVKGDKFIPQAKVNSCIVKFVLKTEKNLNEKDKFYQKLSQNQNKLINEIIENCEKIPFELQIKTFNELNRKEMKNLILFLN